MTGDRTDDLDGAGAASTRAAALLVAVPTLGLIALALAGAADMLASAAMWLVGFLGEPHQAAQAVGLAIGGLALVPGFRLARRLRPSPHRRLTISTPPLVLLGFGLDGLARGSAEAVGWAAGVVGLPPAGILASGLASTIETAVVGALLGFLLGLVADVLRSAPRRPGHG